ncbi:MAG: Spore cortex-lytic enzyme precursor [Pelotomaculum sp. PtaU1.Bin035]|nr:MAG: Spore cortex-lytic enzyme precursor [Pelotomaculum sp. PtaU1.Bin035]
MMKWKLLKKLKLTKKLGLTFKLNKKLYFWAGLFLIPLALALHPAALFKTTTGPEKKEQQATALLTEQGSAARLGQEGGPAGEGEDAAVSRGGAVSRSDVVLLAQVIEGEAADEPYSGKVAVGAVIVNRTKSTDFPKTIPGVVYERDAFESVSNVQYLRPVTAEAIQAATDAVNGADPVGGALYFWNPAKSSSEWVYTRHIVARIGSHVFAR